jgi:small subunit ribosomal protein S1
MKTTNTIDTFESQAALVADNSQALDMRALMERFSMPAAPKRNTIVDGEVVGSTREGYFVSLGQKGDSLVIDCQPGELEVGRSYQFFVLSELDDEGSVKLSYKRAAIWRAMAKRAESGETVTATVHVDKERGIARSRKTDRVGGLIAYLDGVRCFIPRGEVPKHVRIDDLIGKPIAVKVLSADPNKGRAGEVILSHSRAVEELQLARLSQLKVGDIVSGTVTRIIDAGVLVDLGGELTGLVFRTEVGGDRNASSSDLVKAGQVVDVKVVALSLEKRQVSLSVRAARQEGFLSGIKEGDRLQGVVARFETYGAFVLLGGCIDGLLHISDYGQADGKREKLFIGQEIDVMVKSLDRDRSRISLSRKS